MNLKQFIARVKSVLTLTGDFCFLFCIPELNWDVFIVVSSTMVTEEFPLSLDFLAMFKFSSSTGAADSGHTEESRVND